MSKYFCRDSDGGSTEEEVELQIFSQPKHMGTEVTTGRHEEDE